MTHYLPRKDQEKNQGTPAQTFDLSPNPWEQLSSLSQNKVLKIMKEQVKSKYRQNKHPKNIFFSIKPSIEMVYFLTIQTLRKQCLQSSSG